MALNIPEKIIKNHLIEGQMVAGEEIGIKIDQTLTQDATGTMADLEFETLNIPKVKTELSVSYVDHNTLQVGFENADDHKYLQTIAEKYGIYYSRPGNGICHQLHLERFGKPGKTLIGSDSHTPTGGGIGMMAIGAGGLDVATSMGGSPFYLIMPKVVRINLHNKLADWVSAKDIILKVLSILTTKGNVGTVIEYGGDALDFLTVPERATITNMGAELGVTTSLFPSDEQTKKFLKAQQREEAWIELKADEDAHYERVIDIDLAQLKPMVALPHSPDNVKEIDEIEGLEVDQVAVGSCTNSSYKDLMSVVNILQDRFIPAKVSFIVAPGSKQVFEMMDKAGGVLTLIKAGARIMEFACGFCIGNGQSPKSGGVSLRTNNRNFKGRSGTQDAKIYLVSPEVAAVSALYGKVTNPQHTDIPYKKVEMPNKFIIDDTMIIPPQEKSDVAIFRGPNIGQPPYTEKTEDSYKIKTVIKVGDKITTDHIMPAGQRLKYRSNIKKYSEFVFENLKPDFADVSLKNKEQGLVNLIVAGESYGQGSSREHAAICPMYLGVKFVLAKSIERIHRQNLVNFGIVPLVFADFNDYDGLGENDDWAVENLISAIKEKEEFILKNLTKNKEIKTKLKLTQRERSMLLAGGLLNYIKGNL